MHDRGERRRLTRRVAEKRLRRWTRTWGDWDLGPPPERPQLGHFEKRRPTDCSCSRRQRGRPKVTKGICRLGWRDQVLGQRQRGRELGRLLLRGEDPEGDLVAVL